MTSCPVPLRHLLILFLFAALLLLPTVFFGGGGIDMLVNCMKVRLFARQFWHGDLYPRWLQDHFAGNGSPVFFYYPPMGYFITSFFIFLAPLDPLGFSPIAASVGMAAFVAGTAFIFWMKDEGRDDQAALIGGLLYMSAPYILGRHFNYFALFCSVWAWAWLPLLMMYARRITLRQPYAIGAFACALAALILSNVPMTIMFGPLAVAYGVLYFRKDTLVPQALRLGCGVLLGFGLAAIFLLPAATYLDYSNARMFWTDDRVNYRHYFLVPGLGPNHPLLLTLAVLIMAALTLLYGIAVRKYPKHYCFFACVSLAGIFMSLSVSEGVWALLPVLKMLQYPERFFMLPSLCLAVLASLAMPRLRWLAWVLLLFYTACIFALASFHRVNEADLRHHHHFIYEQFVLNVDFAGLLTSSDLAPQFADNMAALDKGHTQIEPLNGDAVADITTWQPRHIVFHYKATEQSVLRIGQFYFPGFTAFEGSTILPVSKQEHTGQILVAVPPGEGEVRVDLTQLLPELAGKLISLLCVGLLFLYFLTEFQKQNKSAVHS